MPEVPPASCAAGALPAGSWRRPPAELVQGLHEELPQGMARSQAGRRLRRSVRAAMAQADGADARDRAERLQDAIAASALDQSARRNSQGLGGRS